MNPKIFPAIVAGCVLAVAGCGKHEAGAGPSSAEAAGEKSTAEVVAEAERSRHFLAVNKRLELGGTLYGYVDVDGDVLKVAGGLKGLLQNVAKANPDAAPFVDQDYTALFTKLGLTDVKALGVSSVPDGTGFFRNRVFLYTPEGRHGLLAGLGGRPGPFAHLALAPANTDVYSESEIDVPAIYLAIRDAIGQVGGDAAKNQLDEALQKAGEAAMISWLKLINATKGHAVFVFRFDADKTIHVPPGAVLPAFSFMLRIDGVASAVEDALRGSKMLTASEVGGLHVYESSQPLPIEGLKPVIAAEGSTLFVATTMEFLNECRSQKTNLGQDPDFKKALEHVGSEGNGIGFISPRVFRRIRDVETLNPNLPPEVKSIFSYVVGQLPHPDRPLVTLRVNEPDGILVRSYWDRSLKQDMAMLSVYNPVTIGVLASMAIPAFQKVRTASQEKAVLNNLRQLGAAADQFYLEKGVDHATYDDIVGPDKYVKVLVPVAGENYRALRFKQGVPLRVRLANGQTVEYAP